MMAESVPTRPTFKVFRRRYTIVDHHDSNAVEVGATYVLSPAKNPADLAALHTLAENLEPELAADIQKFIAFIEAHPNRTLGSYGKKCLPHITHPKVSQFAQDRIKKGF
jgi:hypothetical protein